MAEDGDYGGDYNDDGDDEEFVEEGEEGEVDENNEEERPEGYREEYDEIGPDAEQEEDTTIGKKEGDVSHVQAIYEHRKKLLDAQRGIPNRLTKYELTAIIGFRAQQIAEGADPYFKVSEGTDPITIAIEEFEKNLIPLVIERPLPSKLGRQKYETYRLDELINVIPLN